MYKIGFIFFILLTINQSFAYELLSIQAISSTKKTFITRTGKRSGLVEGVTHTFTADDVAVIARAKKVTGQYTQWELVNQNLEVPFSKGQMVTSHAAQEYLWALSPEEFRQKFLKSKDTLKRNSLIAKGGLSRGLSESTSGVEPQDTQRGGYLGEFLYEQNIWSQLYFDVGTRYEKETVNLPEISIATQRAILLGHLIYYFEPWKDFFKGRIFTGVGLGWGRSYTSVGPAAQSGSVTLLPAIKLGMALPFNETYDFVFESAFETLQTIDRLEDGSRQTTNQSNARVGFGLRRFF